jgi:alkaline phosphatase
MEEAMKKFFVFLFVAIISLSSFAETGKAKYVFYFIADGMGLSQINATEAYRAAKKGKIGVEKLNFSQFPVFGMTTTYATNSLITDSAAAGTALATGNKTSFETLGMDATGKKVFRSIAEMAKDKGYKIGIITTSNIDDATPAVFYSHKPNREMYKEIDEDLLNSGFDLFAGGWTQGFDIKEGLISKGYIYTDTKVQFKALKKSDKKYFLACPYLDAGSCRYSIDQTDKDISLSEFTSKAVELLDNPKGFFVMIEGGKIDWANHGNDFATAMKDILALEKAVATALEFYKRHPNDTLIVFTSDHETGGFSFGSRELKYKSELKELDKQKVSNYALELQFKKAREFSELKSYVEANFSLIMDAKQEQKLIDAFNKHDEWHFTGEVTRAANSKAGLSWTTNAHTGASVGVFAKGVGEDSFRGYIDNTDVAKAIIKIMGLK